MPKKVFISYRHHQAEWVRDRLVPCLRYGGAEVIIDYETFGAGTRACPYIFLTVIFPS